MNDLHRMLYDRVGAALCELEPIFGKKYELTFIARNKENAQAHVLVTSESDAAIDTLIPEVLAELRARSVVTTATDP